MKKPFNKALFAGLSLALLFGQLSAPAVYAAAANEEVRVIITLKDKGDTDAITERRGRVTKEYRNVGNIVAAEVPAGSLNALMEDSNVLAVEVDQVAKAFVQTVDWGINKVEAPEIWAAGYTGEGVKIAVLDTGIDMEHTDLDANLKGGANMIGGSSYDDDNGHGTHCAGIIAAENNDFGTVGVAYAADLYAVKVLDSTGSGYYSQIISGIDWAISNDMDIISMSLGGSTGSTTLQSAIARAYNAGIVIVAAAGNNGTSSISYPARYTQAVAIGAVNSSDVRASWSNYGSQLDLVAPGVSIYSTYYGNSYATLSGTSMATPYAAGMFALAKEASPALTNAQLETQLKTYAMDLGTSGFDIYYGYGLVQSFVEALTPAPTALPSGGSFTDTDGDASQLTGTISWTAASPQDGISGYRIYWGSSATAKLNATAAYTVSGASAESQTVAANTALPAGATHFLVYSYNAGGDSLSYLAIPIADLKPVPAAGLEASVAAKATPALNKVMLTIGTAAQYPDHEIYYRVVSADPTNLNVGQTLASAGSGWVLNTNGTTAFEITAADGQYIEVAEVDSSNAVTRWGEAGPANDGYTPVKATVTTIVASSARVRAGNSVTLTATVKDETGAVLSNATVKVTVSSPTGVKTTSTLTTNSSGRASMTYRTSRTAIKGTYTVTANTTYSTYTASSATTSFVVY